MDTTLVLCVVQVLQYHGGHLSCNKALFLRRGHHNSRATIFSPGFFPFGLTMQHGDDGERGAAGPAARRRASPGAAAASSSAAGSELSAASTSSSSSSPSTGVGAAQRAIPLGFLGRWLASEVGVFDEGTRLQDGVFAVTVTKCVHISRQKVVTELPQLMRVEYDDHGHPGFYLKVRLHEHISLFQKDER